MADRYLIETSAVDGYLLEDGSGVLLLEALDIALLSASFVTIFPNPCFEPPKVESY
jgi:hypothetical protein